jgi:hypothetical protein
MAEYVDDLEYLSSDAPWLLWHTPGGMCAIEQAPPLPRAPSGPLDPGRSARIASNTSTRVFGPAAGRLFAALFA